MATGSNLLARNQMLQAIKDWNPGSVGTQIKMAAYTTDDSSTVLALANATYGTPSGGSMTLSANVVLNIGAGETVSHLRIQKGDYPNDTYIYKKDITSEAFTFAGTITITSATMSIADPS